VRHIATFARTCLQRDPRRSSVRHDLSLSVSIPRGDARWQPMTAPGPAPGLTALTGGVIVAGHVG
jgi:hypothetical protein